MKPTVKIALLLGAGVVCAGVVLWRGSRSGRVAEPAPVTVAPTTSHANVPPPVTPLAPAAPALVPQSVRPIVEAATSYAERVKAFRALQADLTAAETQALHAYLLSPATFGPQNRAQENWLRNTLLDKLTESPTLPAGLVSVLVAIYQDPAQDIVMRDYAVQHITPVYARAGAEEKAILQQTLWQAAAETDSSIAGTALLALRDLAQDNHEFDKTQLGEAALKLAGDDLCGELSRITALQICGRMGINQAAPLALQLVRKTESVPLQIAAIATLGDVGDEAARQLLRQLATQSEPRLRPALETALKKMNGRLGI